MTRHLTTAILILAASSAVAVTANLLRTQPLDWIRRDLPSPPPAAPSAANARPTPTSEAKPTEPPPPQAASAAGNTVNADVVLNHMTKSSARFVDAREVKDYAEGHLRGALHIPASAIYQNIGRLLREVPTDSKTPIIVYCGGGDCEASHNVTDALSRDFHYENVAVYTKGWEEVMKDGRFKSFINTGGEP